MRTTDDYLAAGAAHDADFESRFAPYNQPEWEGDPEPECEGCGETPVTYNGLCDRCQVANAEACGDWDSDSIAAFHRIHQTPITC